MFGRSYGFLINDNIQVDVNQRRIIKLHLSDEKRSNVMTVTVITLKDINMALLTYLLSSDKEKPVKREDIMRNVWDNRNLKSSSQALWATLKDLKSNLAMVGLDENFISIDRSYRYSINAKKIEKLYVS